jgi:hypothetical protein
MIGAPARLSRSTAKTTPERWRVVEVRESTVGTGVPEVVLEPVD